ncbi:hypothetical protein AMST5_02906 [freshwater sediment metagenome]|uniref:Resolvase/invertase-type recombinase catalytic domain-containing protein n=1 Tax=freshwater sediment metagenome TaxID=556182 RepID=A0AA48M5E3_9ZZZZ
MAKAYSYIRFSTPEQARGDSLRRQLEKARAYAERKGLELDDTLTFEDKGISGFSGANARRGALRRFLHAIEQGLIPAGSYLLVESLDRVSRQDPWEALPVFQQIINAGVMIVTVQDDRVWSREELRANPFRIMESLMVMIRANEESATKSKRIRAARDAARAEVRRGDRAVFTARCPAWLRAKVDRTGFEVIEERGAIVRRIYEMAASGLGQLSIAATLNGEGIATWGDAGRRPAGHWRRSYIVKLLRSPAVVGVLVPHTIETVDEKRVRVAQDPVPGYYPPVVEEELYRRVAALQDEPRNPGRGRHAGKPIQNVLGGVARCWRCGGVMTRVMKGSGSKAGRPYLVCEAAKVGKRDGEGRKVCEYRAAPLDPIEVGLRDGILEAIEQAPGPGQDPQLDGLIEGAEVAIAARDENIGNVLDAIAETGGTRGLTAKLRELEKERDVAKAELIRLQERRATAFGPFLANRLTALGEALEAEPFDRGAANARLREACFAVTVDPDQLVLTLHWKHGGESSIAYGWPGVTNKPRGQRGGGKRAAAR